MSCRSLQSFHALGRRTAHILHRNASTVHGTSQRTTLPHLPELYNPDFLDALLPRTSVPNQHEGPVKLASDPSPLLAALATTSNQKYVSHADAPVYKSTLSPVLDAFVYLRDKIDKQSVDILLPKAWAEDPQLALKIIWNIRSIHEGKQHKEGFYRAFGWLYEHHPRTAIANLHMLVDPVCPVVGQETHRASHGYWKDLLNILALAVVGELGLNSSNFLHRPRRSRKRNRGWTSHTGKRKNNQDRFLSRKERRPLIAERRHDALVRKLEDPKFRALYVGVARLFAGRLVKDWQLSAGLASKDLGSTQVRKELRKILSPVGKWAPTPGGSHDRFTNITTAISSVIYHSRDSIPDIPFPKALESIDEAASVHQSLQGSTIMRSYLRRWILAPLRQLTSVTESLMGTKQWNKINYSLVPSYCMKNNVKVFSKHGGGGLKEYLAGVSQGKRSISSSILSPTDIVNQTRRTNLKKLSSDSRDRELTKPEQREERAAALNFRQLIMDAQWRSLVDRYRQLGILHNSLAITGGGSGVDPAVALAFFINQLAPPPFRGGMIVGGIYPRYFTYQPDAPLSQVLGEIEELYGYRFNLYSVFVDLLLPIAKLHHVRKEDMIKRLYVLHNGDMTAFEKDYRPIAGKWETHQDKMEAAFRDAGYDVPEVVYWDVSAHDSGNTGTPVLHDKDGVALFSNPSPTPLKVLTQMEPSDPAGFTPYSVMMKVLGRPSYDGLRVLD